MATLTVTLIQSSLFWEDKLANLKMFKEKIESISQKTEVVILPEMFSTGFTMKPEELAETMDGTTIQWMKKLAIQQKIIITGSLIIREGEQYFNRLIWMLPNGNFATYDKRHLFSYAGEHDNYTPGSKKLIASVNGWKINLQVCYDLRFPVWARQPQDLDTKYDLLINVANWPKKRSTAWKTLLQARAIENQSFVIGVNRVGEDGNHHIYEGDSMIIDPLGEILYHKNTEEDIFTYTLQKERIGETRNHFPFLDDADCFFIQP
ncbi:MAG: amidohydrolase [Ginsengibacter sp.]|jgi:predicted amidohydrolase